MGRALFCMVPKPRVPRTVRYGSRPARLALFRYGSRPARPRTVRYSFPDLRASTHECLAALHQMLQQMYS
ncbi:hypothetical protein KI387_009827, partial [Taxus chinensis]